MEIEENKVEAVQEGNTVEEAQEEPKVEPKVEDVQTENATENVDTSKPEGGTNEEQAKPETTNAAEYINDTESLASEEVKFAASPHRSSKSSSAGTESRSLSLKTYLTPTASEELRRAIAAVALLLDDVRADEVVARTEKLKSDFIHLSAENRIFRNFLAVNEPEALDNMDELIDRTEAVMAIYGKSRKFSSRMSTVSGFSVVSGYMGPFITGNAPITKINLSQKIDLVLREMEDIKQKSEQSKKKNHAVRACLLAELEELDIRKREIDLTTLSAQKLRPEVIEPAMFPVLRDKYLKFLRDWIYKSRDTVDKFRLRTSTLQAQYHKMCVMYNKKLLIGENLSEVDFDNLRILNLHLMQKIDQQGLLLRSMKEMNGKANLLVSQHKQLMLEKEKEKLHMEKIIKEIERRTCKMDMDMEKASKELKQAETKHHDLEKLVRAVQTPPILDYIDLKIKIRKLQHDHKIWSRKADIKRMSFHTYLNQMKKTLGTKTVNPEWYS